MPQYRVRQGMHFGASKEYKAGDVVELTEAEALGFLDKLALADETDGRELVTTAPGLFETTAADTGEDAPHTAVVADTLPDGFPYADKLAAGGYTTLTAVDSASDDDLLAVKGIGKASLQAIREAL